MDKTEKVVDDHLKHRGYTDIVYEPDGNIPPDFLVNGGIAVEVRRLNQNHSDELETKGLEEISIPLWNKVKNLVTSIGPAAESESWFVYFRFTRPVERWKTLEPKIRAGLVAFSKASVKTRTIVAKGRGFELEVFCRTLEPHSTMFVMAGCSDEESGGWLLSELESNINYCANEKSRKIEKFRSKYPQWWLALVDHIGYSLDDFERELFQDQVSIDHDWDKIILIDPRDHRRWFEI